MGRLERAEGGGGAAAEVEARRDEARRGREEREVEVAPSRPQWFLFQQIKHIMREMKEMGER